MAYRSIIRSSETDTTHNECLKISYRSNYNILELHQRCLNILESEKKNKLEFFKNVRSELVQKLRKENISVNKKKIFFQKITDIDAEIKTIGSGKRLQDYISDADPIVETFRGISVDDKKSRQYLTSRFFQICEKFIAVEIMYEEKIDILCLHCAAVLPHMTSEEGETVTSIACGNCGVLKKIFPRFNNTIDCSDYEDRMNFNRAIQRFQGKEKVMIPDILFCDLNNYFSTLNIPTGDQIKAMPLKDGRRGSLGKRILRKALEKCGYQHFYDNINLITNEYWGWDLPDIGYLEDKLMNHYDKTEIAFKKIKGPRRGSINTQWRLKQHLLILNYPVQDDDFKTISTREILEYYDSVWNTMCTESNDPEIVNGYRRTI